MIQKADYFKILLDDEIIGGVILLPDKGNNICIVARVYIHPDHHNKGLGKAVFKMIEEKYDWVKKWVLDTPEWAVRNHRFYTSIGYVKISEVYSKEDGFNLWYFQKTVP